jgi:hypothetical protein
MWCTVLYNKKVTIKYIVLYSITVSATYNIVILFKHTSYYFLDLTIMLEGFYLVLAIKIIKDILQSILLDLLKMLAVKSSLHY